MPSKVEGNSEEPMNFSEEHIELFRSYLNNEMSAERYASFGERLDTDSEFRHEYEEFKAFEQALSDVETLEIYDQVKGLEENHRKNKSTSKARIIWLSAASVAAIVLIAFLIWEPESPEGNDSIVASHFQPYDNVVTVRGKKETLDKALYEYDQKNYKAALKLFQKFPDDSVAIFYRAETLMALKEYKASIVEFERVTSQEGIFMEVASYHKALAYLGDGKIKKAKVALKSIPKESFYYKEAREVLKSL